MGNCITAEDVGMSTMKNRAVDQGVGQDDVSDVLGFIDRNAGLKQRVGLTFSCSDLPNLDKHSKTDAFLVLWALKDSREEKIG